MKFVLFSSALFFIVGIVSCTGTRPPQRGVTSGKLMPCPDKPNCVCSQASETDQKHYIRPIRYTVSRVDAVSVLKKAVQSMKRSKIIEEKDDYLYAEYTSAIFRFVDDVEFYIDDASKIIHVRSASRLGYGDMGVNRKRVETIRSLFLERLK